jgi:hypothetical protein
VFIGSPPKVRDLVFDMILDRVPRVKVEAEAAIVSFFTVGPGEAPVRGVPGHGSRQVSELDGPAPEIKVLTFRKRGSMMVVVANSIHRWATER